MGEGSQMLRMEAINGKNVWDILKLRTKDVQKGFVASNEESLIEAYTTIVGGGHAFTFGLYDADMAVGFMMLGFGTEGSADGLPDIAEGNYNLWRLMIDRQYQGKGYGTETVRLALDFIRTYPCGSAEYCWLSYEPENDVARKLYNSFGFRETGEMDEGEVVAALRL